MDNRYHITKIVDHQCFKNPVYLENSLSYADLKTICVRITYCIFAKTANHQFQKILRILRTACLMQTSKNLRILRTSGPMQTSEKPEYLENSWSDADRPNCMAMLHIVVNIQRVFFSYRCKENRTSRGLQSGAS